MSDQVLTILLAILTYGLIALALSTLGILLFKGRLGEKGLALGPTRDLGLPPRLYLVGIVGTLLYSACLLVVSDKSPKAMQLVAGLFPLMLAGLLIGQALQVPAGLRKIGLLPRHPARDLMWGVAAGIVGLGLAGGVGLIVNAISFAIEGKPVDPVAHDLLKQLREDFSTELLVEIVIGAVILAPLLEELVFRGLFQTSLLRLFKGMRWPALLVASAVFAVIHWSVVPWQWIIPLFAIGLVFGYVYERTGSLLTPIIAHAVFNALNVTLAVVMPEIPAAG